uniref:Zinc finger protein 326 n=2 Tax=Platyrrhini TaxID=9479 RepID=A0A2K5R5G1_CEBIM
MDFEDDYTHSACRNTYQGFNGMDRDYGPGSYGGLAFKDIYLKILLLSASKAYG